MIKRNLLLCLCFSLTCGSPAAQLLKDPEGLKWVQEGINHIYNFEFSEAEALTERVGTKYPKHPVTYLLNAFRMYWQYLPIQENKARLPEYRGLLNACLEATKKQYGSNSTDPEAVFFTMVSHGYLALAYNYQGEFLKAVGEARKAYKSLLAGMKLTHVNPDFFFPTGMYNYYVIVYPETTPIVKPLMIFFKDGDKSKGLGQIETGARKGVITLAESCFYLAHIYLEQESRPEKALHYTSRLHQLFPGNPVFRMKYIETLLFNARYEEAERETRIFRTHTGGFFISAAGCFQGILAEHRGHDEEAGRHYRTALSRPPDAQYTREYHAMAYAGLARIAHRAGKRAEAKGYYKKCLEKAAYKSLIKEASAYR